MESLVLPCYRAARWRWHIVEFERQLVERMKTCENIGALVRDLDLLPSFARPRRLGTAYWLAAW